MASLAAGCGTAVAPATLHGAPRSYLLTVDQLVSQGFTVDVPAHELSAATVAGPDSSRATRLANAGFTSGAAVDYFRRTADIREANGPVQVGDTVEIFGSAAGASSVLADDVARLDAAPGAVAVSTGPLGDAAHATLRTVGDSTGVTLVEVNVEWRVANLLDILVLRGRDGGTRLDDALVLAHEQTISELGLPTPTPLPTPKPTAAPSSTVTPASSASPSAPTTAAPSP